MATSILGIGVSALNAAQAGLQTTSHNISNASTPGFSRQSAVQATAVPQFSGAGYLGQGTNVETIKRSYSDFLDTQLREATTQSAYLNQFQGQLSTIDNLLADPSAGLTPSLSAFTASVNALANNPADAPSRQQMLASAQTLSGRFRDIATQLQNLREGVNSSISSTVSQINSQANAVAALNDRIRTLQGSGQPPNDLLDQRNMLLQDLASQIRISVVPVADGTVNVFMPNGQGLVMGTQGFPIAAQPDPANPAELTVGLSTAAGFKPMRESDITGGALGGMLAFRNQVLNGAENALGRVAEAFSASFNAQHAAGQDLNGALGAAFFSTGSGPQVVANSGNTGTGQINAAISSAAALGTSDYRVLFDGTNYTVTRLSDNNAQVFSSLPQTVDGVNFNLASGTPAAGDSFLVLPVRNAALNFSTLISDTSAIAAAQPVRGTAAAANTSTATLGVTTVTPPAGVNLQQAVTITFTGANTFSVSGTGTGNPTGLTFTPGMSVSYNGWSATFNGSPANGDVFTVGPNTGGRGDNGNLLALAGVESSRILNSGSASVHDAYAQLVSSIGTQAHAALSDSKAQAAVTSQAEAAQQSVSGVNLDEEAAALLKYQQAYQAAGKVISTANTLFQEILAIMR